MYDLGLTQRAYFCACIYIFKSGKKSMKKSKADSRNSSQNGKAVKSERDSRFDTKSKIKGPLTQISRQTKWKTS